MKKGPVYLHLSRGSQEPRLTSTSESGGPVFGPYQTIRFSDHQLIYMERDSGSDILRRSDRGVYYDGAYHQEWFVSSAPESSVTAYDSARIEPPRGDKGGRASDTAPSGMTLEERFRRLFLLCESLIEDRLSILCEDDPVMRDDLLTSDIEDQIGHWQAAQKELMDLN